MENVCKWIMKWITFFNLLHAQKQSMISDIATTGDIQIWKTDVDTSDDESSVASVQFVEQEIPSNLDLNEHLQLHLQHFLNIINLESTVIHNLSTNRFLISKPTASAMNSNFLHPGIYRSIAAVHTFDEIARLLNVIMDWRSLLENARRNNPYVDRSFRRFASFPSGTPELLVENAFSRLVSNLSSALSKDCEVGLPIKYAIGGCLAG
jgi:endonuclease IV